MVFLHETIINPVYNVEVGRGVKVVLSPETNAPDGCFW